MTPPKLPEPEHIDGRRLYTAGQMRAYGKSCFEMGRESLTIAGRTDQTSSPKPDMAGDYSAAVNDLIKAFGMTK